MVFKKSLTDCHIINILQYLQANKGRFQHVKTYKYEFLAPCPIPAYPFIKVVVFLSVCMNRYNYPLQ